MKNYFILRRICRKVYLAGSGNFWYEGDIIGEDRGVRYRIYKYVLFAIYGLLTFLEIMAALLGDFPKEERRDSITFAVSHTIVMCKIFSVIYNKELIKTLNRKMVNVCAMHEDEALMAEKYKIMKVNVLAYVVAVYGSTACFIYDGVRKMNEGSHFVTVVTYWPAYEDNSSCANAFRIFTTIVLCVLMVTMVSVDLFAMIYLIMYKYKFITLGHYFQHLKDDFDRNLIINRTLAETKLTQDVVNGIIMHIELLSISKDIDGAFGTVMALQVCQSSGSAVTLLLQIALSDQLTFVAAMKIIFFVIALFFLLALFLCNAGEITYQASLLSNSIFYCGWHATEPQPPSQRNLRRIVLIATAHAQRPLVMKAFKMLELTYATFILVLRGTYSVFALFYAQNK